MLYIYYELEHTVIVSVISHHNSNLIYFKCQYSALRDGNWVNPVPGDGPVTGDAKPSVDISDINCTRADAFLKIPTLIYN